MKKYTEEELKKKFNIKDFRHLSKKKFIEIVSKLDSLDPEVAIELIGVIPNFYSFLGDITKELSNNIQKEIDAADSNAQESLKAIMHSIDLLQSHYNDPSLSEDERIKVMTEIGKYWEQYERILKLANEHKENILNKAVLGFCAVAMMGMSVLAVSFNAS